MQSAPRERARVPWRALAAAVALSIPLLIVLQALFAGSLALVRSGTDVEAIRANLRTAFERGYLSDDQVPKPFLLRGGHQFTECVGLNVAIDDQPDVWRSALAPKLHFEMIDSCRELHRALDGEAAPLMDYSRYWHGYRLLLWPTLDHFGLLGLRAATALLVALACVVFVVGLRGAIGPLPAAVLFLSFMMLTDLWRIWRVSSHGISMAVILAGAGLFAMLVRRRASPVALMVAAAMLGAVFNFVDFLINPPIMPMLLAFIVMGHAFSATSAPRNPWQAWLVAVLVTLFWFGGYAFTWVAKWLLAVVILDGWQTASGILSQITFRLYGLEAGSRIVRIPLVPTLSMLPKAFESFLTPLVLLLAAAVHFHERDHRESFDWRQFWLLLTPILIAVIWFEVLSNHTQAHPNFVARSASMAVALAITAPLIACKAPATWALLWQGVRRRLPWRERG